VENHDQKRAVARGDGDEARFSAGGKVAIMRALYVSVDNTYTPGDTVAEIHDYVAGEWDVTPREASDADLLVPVADGHPVGIAWQIRGAIHGAGVQPTGEPRAIVVTMGHAVQTEGLVPATVPSLERGVALVEVHAA